jgi:hypothetical protein
MRCSLPIIPTPIIPYFTTTVVAVAIMDFDFDLILQ